MSSQQFSLMLYIIIRAENRKNNYYYIICRSICMEVDGRHTADIHTSENLFISIIRIEATNTNNTHPDPAYADR